MQGVKDPTGNEEVPLRYPTSNPSPPPLQDDPEKAPSMNKTHLPDKALGPETIPVPHQVSTPKDPVLEKAPESDNISASEKTTLDKAATPGSILPVDEAPAPEAPTQDEALEQKMALHGDNGPVLVEILTPEHMVFEEDCPRDSTGCQCLPQEEATQGSESRAFPNAIRVPGEYPHQPNSSERRCCKLEQGDSSPAQSKAELLEGTPAKHKATLNEALPKEELPSEWVGPQKHMPPKESVPAPQVPHTVNQIPGQEEEAPTLDPVVPQIFSKSKNGSEDIESLKEEVWSLKSALELLESKME